MQKWEYLIISAEPYGDEMVLLAKLPHILCSGIRAPSLSSLFVRNLQSLR